MRYQNLKYNKIKAKIAGIGLFQGRFFFGLGKTVNPTFSGGQN